jgi:hypothetical protein
MEDRIDRRLAGELMGADCCNPSDLPASDLPFGTLRSPRFIGECGFEAGANRRVAATFAFADVNVRRYGPGSLGAKPLRLRTGAPAPLAPVRAPG